MKHFRPTSFSLSKSFILYGQNQGRLSQMALIMAQGPTKSDCGVGSPTLKLLEGSWTCPENVIKIQPSL